MKIAEENEEVVKEPGSQVFFTSFGDSALNMLLLFWVSRSDPYRHCY